ncbi:hypothetical protein P9112_005980 [Eukaryota sp. TZLM1-RC]
MIITSSQLETLLKNLQDVPSIRGIRKFSQILYSVCHATDEVSEEEDSLPVLLDTADDHQTVIIFALTHLRHIFDTLLSTTTDHTSSPKWPTLQRPIKLIIASITHFIASLTNLGNSDIINIVLLGASTLSPFFAQFPNLAKVAVASSLKLWTQEPDRKSSLEEQDQFNRSGASLPAFQFLSSLVKEFTSSSSEMAVKILRRSIEDYLSVARFTSDSSQKFHKFLLDTLTDLFSSCPSQCTYPSLFYCIREAARVLRGAVISRKNHGKAVVGKDKFYSKGKKLTQSDLRQKALSATQFARLRFLTRIVGELVSKNLDVSNNPGDFALLLQPIFSILNGTASIANSPSTFPARLLAVELIIDLSIKTDTYCHVISLLTPIIESPSITGKLSPTPKNSNFVNVELTLKASEGMVGTLLLAQPVLEKTTNLIKKFAYFYRSNPSFPELLFAVISSGKLALKTANRALFSGISDLIDELTVNVGYIRKNRSLIDFPMTSEDSLKKFIDSEAEKCPLGKVLQVKRIKNESQEVKIESQKSRKSRENDVKKPRLTITDIEVNVNSNKEKEPSIQEEQVRDLVLSSDEDCYVSDSE